MIIILMFSFTSCQKEKKLVSKKEINQIVKTATLLYKNQLAYTEATNMLNDSIKLNWNQLGDIFTYEENKDLKCIFVNKDSIPKVLAEVVFDSLINQKAEIDYTLRSMTKKESDLLKMRSEANRLVEKEKFLKQTRDMMLDYVAVILNEDEKFVYVFPTPIRINQIFYGNDCRIVFNRNNKIIRKEIYHDTVYSFELNPDYMNFVSHNHSENQSKLMTPTDLCISMLEAKNNKNIISKVISTDYISLWGENKKLIIEENNSNR